MAWLGAGPALAAGAAALLVEVEGVRSGKGAVHVCLWLAPRAFPSCGRAGAVLESVVPAREGRVAARFSALPPGRYAVSAFHDEDGDGHLARRSLGMPREGAAVSLLPPGSPGPPAFDAASFRLRSGERRRLRVRLEYSDAVRG